jgi:tetraacyldisaccharide 4'-kinase
MAAGAGEAPPFWWEPADWRAWALSPASLVYGGAAGQRMRGARRVAVDAPVLCVGNFTVGGEGKTPVAIALAQEARRKGLVPGFLSRGHGGSLSRPHLVDPHHDGARLVGDEPLLLARHAPTAVTADRAAGAKRLLEEGCDFLIMDDGFQSARIHVDYALVLVDAVRGIGNGHVLPGGPLRAPMVEQLRHTHAILRMGEGHGADQVVRMAARAARPVYEARLAPLDGENFAGRRVLAFAGIGNPEKFFASLRQAGAQVELTRSFPDHHAFSQDDIEELTEKAEKQGLKLVTTAKDMVRLKTALGAVRDFAARVHVLEVAAVFDPPSLPGRIIGQTLAAARERRLG